MNVLEIKNLSKFYSNFALENANITLQQGYIMGFIGENGAGKTTLLHSMLNIIKKDSGQVKILGKSMDSNEIDIKQDIAFMSGDTIFFPRSKLAKITNVFKKFYHNWDDAIYDNYIKLFKLDTSKRIDQLSQGMRIKYSIALALSHKAKFIILDEPTSGLDPVARDMLLEIFQSLVETGEISILFSTHITSDLEKCADYITFIQNGRIIESTSKDELLETYRLVRGTKDQIDFIKDKLVSYKTNTLGFTGLMKTTDTKSLKDVSISPPTLDDIMIYFSTYRGV